MSDRLTGRLMALARDEGASAVGVTTADVFEGERRALRAGIASGRSGPLQFTYESPDLATDVRSSFSWARRIVAVSWNYLADSSGPPGTGAVVGRFASSNHYEEVERITDAIAVRLRTEGFRAEVLIDDNRLVDRAVAVRAGVGWWGKSTMVLAPGYGPWTLLGSVVTDAPLDTTEPMRRGCGTCVACIPACPTGAIDESGLDARRCLSTWLQTPNSMPQWIRPRLGRRIYGCDDCLTSCPPGGPALTAAVTQHAELSFPELLGLTDDELLDRFSFWYVPRREGRFIRRNVLVAAGNSAEPGAREAIKAHLTHPSSMIRGHAAWALARGFGAEADAVLRAALTEEMVPEASDELALALLMIRNSAAHRSLLAVEEWARTNKVVRGLALLGADSDRAGSILVLVLSSGSTGPPEFPGVEMTVIGPGGHAPTGLDDRLATSVIVYDPKRRLETLRRDAVMVTSS